MLTIGIAGGTGSGKTTVAKAIVDKLGAENVALLSQDSYYCDNSSLTFAQRQRINYDHPDAFDTKLLLEHLKQLQKHEIVPLPIYDFSEHTRLQKTIPFAAKPVLVIEGIHVLTDADIRQLLDIKVFVDTDADVRVLRRVIRDIEQRGRTIESIYNQYLNTVKPMHDAFVEPSKRYADLIIPEGGQNQIAIELLTSLVERYLLNHSSTPELIT